MYQREVVALIRATGARVSILSDHRLVDLWREYSARQYQGGWIKAYREEVLRFVTWTNNYTGITQEIMLAKRRLAGARVQIRQRSHAVRGWDGKPLKERRLHT